MEDGALTPNISDSVIDFNLINELLYDGFWLDATDGSNLWKPGPTTTTLSNLNSTSSYFPNSEINTLSVNTIQHQQGYSKGTEKSRFYAEQALSYLDMDEFSASQSQNQSAVFLVEESQVNRRLWVGPNRNPFNTISVKKRLVQAINCLKDCVRDKDVLIQIWIPVKSQGRQVLTTNNQPFSLNPNCKNLANYRDVSQNYQFEADETSTEFLGLPGRVFLNKLPEWTPDVRFFKREEYPRVKHAQQYDVRGSLALPVFEQGSRICLGVVEIVTTDQKVDFHPELENVCKALEAVDLKSNILSPCNIEDCDESYQSTLTEIRNTLRFVCNAHKLPLALVWASCLQQCKGGCRHSHENYAHCVSTIESACYVADAQVTGFHEACSQHHLLKGEGVPGKAFLTNQPCFSENVTAFSKTEYPLAHHARVFNLRASAAMRLRSTYNATADFVLEFFLPLNCKGAQDQMLMLHSLTSIVQQTCQSLRVIKDEELAQETAAGELDDGKYLKLAVSASEESSYNASSQTRSMVDPQHKGKGVYVTLTDHKEELPDGEFKITTAWDNSGLNLHYEPATLEHVQLQQDSEPKTSAEDSGNFTLTIGDLSLGSKASSQKTQKKTNKAISLQVLRQYFAGSLKEAAKNIGVCPTTLKRICRQHGITRWPSRKIKKVSHSLRKLQLVIDSVQGAEGSIQLSTFYNNFPELVSPNVPAGSSHLSTLKTSGHLQQVNEQVPEGTLLSPATTASKSPSSSGSHSSSSSYCCSTGAKQSSFPVNSSSLGNVLSVEQSGGMLKKARSDVELHGKGHEETKPLIRSYSHKLFSNHTTRISAQAMPKNSNLQAHHVGVFRVKAAFGEEKIRLSLPSHWGFKDLREEILRRFNIENGTSVNLKYLDDDAEWVLLTCDDDLEECRDIQRSSKNRTIKLSVNHLNPGGSFGSNGPW